MHHRQPNLSIIIIAFNEENYIGPCLEAIKHQTVQPDEVILVDNNSTDKTVTIARSYPFVRIMNEPEQGMIPARDAGFNAAKGDLLARIDADTRIPPEWVRKVHEVMDNRADTICGVSGPQYFYEVDHPLLQKLSSAVFSLFGYFGISRILLRHETLFGSNMIITKPAWEKVRKEVCHDGQKVHEDMDMAIHIGKYGTILFDKQLLVGTSARPLREGANKIMWRFTTWVKTVTIHRKLFVGPGSSN